MGFEQREKRETGVLEREKEERICVLPLRATAIVFVKGTGVKLKAK